LANTDSPRSNRFKGWFFDAVNNRLEFWFNGTKVAHLSTSGMSITDDVTARMTDGRLQTPAGVELGSGGGNERTVFLGSVASAASNGANSLVPNIAFVAPAALSVISAFAVNISTSDVTVGTATSSASFRRTNLIANTAAAGSGTTIVASLNATASAASRVSRGITPVAGLTVPAGSIIQVSHLTVGAATADGTDMADKLITLQYELV
jgi:hypothetical protein